MKSQRSLAVSTMQLLLAVTLFAPTYASAQIYKWKDENGKIHFSDQPPEDKKTSVQEMRTASRPPSKPYLPSSAKSATDSPQAENAGGAAVDAEEMERQQRIKEQECARARGYLKVLDSPEAINMPDASGALKPVDQAQRSAEKNRIFDFLQKNCQR